MTARGPTSIRFSMPAAPPRVSTKRRVLPLNSTPLELPPAQTQLSNLNNNYAGPGGDSYIHDSVDVSSLRDFRRKFPNQQWSELVLKEKEVLGRGSGTTARKVQDRRNGDVLLQKTIAMRERYVSTLLKQISLISSVKHPNIVDFYGAYLSPTSREVNLITEFCDGGSLKSVGDNITRLQLVIPGERAMSQIINGIFQALNHLDSLGIIHGGIKPSNILLTQSGRVKLCDFGISEDLVYVGMDKLSVSYAAPERIRGEKYDIRADVWSAGLSILEFAQSRYPYTDPSSEVELMIQITAGEPPRLHDQDGIVEYTEGLKDMIKQSLTMDASARSRPSALVSHPWLVQMLQKPIDMRQWIRQATSVGVKPNRRFTVNVASAHTSSSGSRPRSMSVKFKHREAEGSAGSPRYSYSTYGPV